MPSEYENVVYYEATVEIEYWTYGPDAPDHNMKIKNIAEQLSFNVELDGFGLASLEATGHEFQDLRIRKDALLDSLRVAGFKPRRARIAAIVSMEVL